MNKSRGLGARSILNSSRGLTRDNRGIRKDYNRALKDIKEINFYKSQLYEDDDNSKLIPSDGTPEPNILEEFGIIESKIVEVELVELNLMANIDLPKEQVLKETESDVQFRSKDTTVSDETGPTDENETSIVRAEEDDEENELEQIKEENYNNFIEEYEKIIEDADFTDDFYEKNKGIFDDKLKDIKNGNQIKNYSIGEMVSIIKETLIAMIEHEITLTKKAMIKIETRKEYKDKNYTKNKFLSISKTYKNYDDKLIQLEVNKNNIEIFTKNFT